MANFSINKFNLGSLLGSDYEKKRRKAEDAIDTYRPFEFKNEGALKEAQDALLNREDFKYDVNSDAMYKAYKDMYDRQGNLAMKDTAGQVAAMSGGYGNSYAQTAGQQIYQAYMDTLGDRVPELYNMALNKYQLEGDRLAQNYALLDAERQNEYNRYMDARNILLADRDYYANMAADERNYNHALEQEALDQEWKQKEWERVLNRDAMSDAQWNAQFGETQRMNNFSIEDANRNYNLSVASQAARNYSAPSYAYNTIGDFEKTILSSDEFYEKAKEGTWQTDKKGKAGETKYTYNGVDYDSYQAYAVEQVMKNAATGALAPEVATQLMLAWGYDIDDYGNIYKK